MESTKIQRIKKLINNNQDLFIALEELDRTGKLRKTNYKKRYNFTLDQNLMQEFRTYCVRSNINMSGKIGTLLKDFMKNQAK